MSFLKYGKNEPVTDAFQAFLVEKAKFTDVEEYPIIPAEMVTKQVPMKILPFSKAINYKGDLSDTFICTYEADAGFERIRRNPRKYLPFFKRTAGIIGFDYSIHTDMPLIKQKTQINDNLSLTYYYGSNGVPVIPNIRCGVDELLPEYISAIPKHSFISIGVHGFCKHKYEKYEWYCFIEKLITELEPSGIIVYGSLTGPLFDDFKKRQNFYFFTPWIYDHGEECKENGN